jgi:hypothetical protein
MFFLSGIYLNADARRIIDQPSIQSDSIFFKHEFFANEEILNFFLEFDLTRYKQEKSKEEYLPGIVSYFIEDSVEIKVVVKVKARGESRHKLCELPPFWVNFKHAGDKYLSNAGNSKIKIVTLCDYSSEYRKYLLKEYLIYKLFNKITELSFRVRLVNITYIDIGKRNREMQSVGFFIEPEEMLASRNNVIPIKVDNLNYYHVDSISADIMCFFQYMIGNTDFTVNGRHNIKLLKYIDHTKPLLYAVPYDFDYAGLINAEYAKPAAAIPIDNVTERYFLGLCRSDEQYLRIIKIFKSKKEELYTYIDSAKYLDKKIKKETNKYLNEFYKEIENPKFIKRIRKYCR